MSMKKLDKKTQQNFPWVLFLAFFIALAVVFVLDDPLTYLRTLFVDNNFFISSFTYTVVLAISVIVSPFSIAPTVPFVAKILSPPVTFMLTVIGWGIGSSIAFFIARKGGRGWIQRVYPIDRVEQNNSKIPKDPSTRTLLLVRMFTNTDNFSYHMGLKNKITFPNFLLISIASSLPAAFIFSYSAEAITDGDKILLFMLFFAVSLIALSYLVHRGWSLIERPARVYSRRHSFVAGEIMATAALLLFFKKRDKKYQLIRANDNKTIRRALNKKRFETYVLDRSQSPDEINNVFGVAGDGAGIRGNGIPYQVFGLVWKKFGTTICDSDIIAKKIEESLVWGIDIEATHTLEDGTVVERWSLSKILEDNFIEQLDSDKPASAEEDDRMYQEAVAFARDFLAREIEKYTPAE